MENEDNILVRCPNMCLDGHVKHWPNEKRALWVLKDCPVCNGKGKLTKKEAEIAEKNI